MRRLAIILFIALSTASIALAQSDDRQHTVQANETLFSIAQEYEVSVQAIAQANNITDPNSIRVGQVLTIPSTATTSTSTTATPNPSATPAPRVHLVGDGENLYTIAGRYGVTVVSLAQLNGITDYNLVRIGQRLTIPSQTSPLAPPNPDGSATTSTAAVTPIPVNEASAVSFAVGVQAYNAEAAAQVGELGADWVNLLVKWSEYETTRGNIDFDKLNTLVNAYDSAGVNILLTVTAAPAWARAITEENGPPNVNADYAAFVGAVAENFAGVVDAYEIWHEPNLRREWNGKPLGAAGYVDLLKLAYNAIKLQDPAAIIVTAGLAPTATNDGVNAIDDRRFLEGMYTAGVASFSDAIGVHPRGWANPADSTCCQNNRPTVLGWDDQKAFFFLDTLRDYRQIMNRNNDSGTFLWVTSFGWGTADEHEGAVNPDFGYVTYTDLNEQAQYTVRAFQLGRDLTYVGPMFVSNLNACQVLGADQIDCWWSLLDAAGEPRPVFNAVKLFAQ